MKKVTLKNIINDFELIIVNKEEVDLDREIKSQSIHRLGLELAGKKDFGDNNNIIGWGTKEQKFFNSLGKEKARELISKAITKKVPFVVLSLGIKKDILDIIIEVADKTKTPVLKSNMHLSIITSSIVFALATLLAEEVNKHASLVIVNGVGVMIMGKSGIGKSEAVMELVQTGSIFVADDTVIVKRIGKRFYGKPAELTRDILEVRGVGLINIKTIYGIQSIRKNAKIELIVELIDMKNTDEVFDRLGHQEKKENILGGYLPKIKIPVKEGRTIASLIKVAVNAYIARKLGDNPIETIGKRRKKDEIMS